MGEMCVSFVLYVRDLRDLRKIFPRGGLQEVRKVVPLHSQSREGYAPEAPAEVGVSGSGKRIFQAACRNEKLSYLCTHITARGAGDAETEIIDIKIRQGHRPS